MKTLVIYDNIGKIFSQTTGDYALPLGIQYIECEVPYNHYIKRVDVKNKVAVFEKLPLGEKDIMQNEIDSLKLAIAELAELTLGGN